MTSPWWRSDALEWNSHGWTLEVRGDEIADIRRRGSVVLRAARAVVRDRGWATVPVIVRNVAVGADSLVLALEHEGLGAVVSSTLTVRADHETLSIGWSAVSHARFETCRTGLVALHPPSDAGRAVVVVHPDGSEAETMFPVEISPHQPIRDIRELRIDGGPRVTFSGEIFEMEDQRNWTDASFKTYSRPLDRPYPYPLDVGAIVEQSIVVSAPVDADPPIGVVRASRIELIEDGRFPEIGVEASTAPDPVPPSSAGSFRVVELDLTTLTWRAALGRAARDGKALAVHLVTDGGQGQLVAAADALVSLSVPVLRVSAFDKASHVTSTDVAARVHRALRMAGVGAAFSSGARSHFTELNRESDTISRDADAASFTVTPLFHAADTEQLVESVAMQRLVAEQAVRIADGRGVHIGPISLRPRFNNVATTPERAPSRTDLSQGYGAEFTGACDERQTSPELGAWVVASAAALAVRGVMSVAWFETWGPRGLADESGHFPADAAVAALADLGGCVLLTSSSPDGLIWAVGGRRRNVDVLLVANIDSCVREIEISVTGRRGRRVTLAQGTWVRIVA